MPAIIPIDVNKATPRLMRAVRADAYHNEPRAWRLTLNCETTSRVAVACVLRGYDQHGRRVLRETIGARLVKRHPPIHFEDYSGWTKYSSTRSLYYYPTNH